MFYEKYVKRILDIFSASVLIIVLSGVFLIVGILIVIKLGRPVFFKQKRPGKNEKIFWLFKFRTMTESADEEGNLLPDEKRHTKFGRKLRLSGMDELPELWNILKGDMSFVGPRPLLVEYLNRYSAVQRHRHDVFPGLTGYAQINGRNNISFEKKFKYDLYYVDNISFLLDIKIIFKTFLGFFHGGDSVFDKEMVTKEFLGNKDIKR